MPRRTYGNWTLPRDSVRSRGRLYKIKIGKFKKKLQAKLGRNWQNTMIHGKS